MRVTLVLPDVARVPVGGLKVAYQLANGLAARGHLVNVLHLDVLPARAIRARASRNVRMRAWRLGIGGWAPIAPGVKVGLVHPGRPAELGDGDRLVAVGWRSVDAVADAPPRAGTKAFLAYDNASPSGEQAGVDAAWRRGLPMLVTARWLIEPARRMSGGDVPVHFVPLGLGAEFRPVVDPSVRDPLSLGTYFHPAPHKGFSEALRVFELVRERHPVRVIVFGGARPRAPLPPWMTFHLLPRTPLPIYSAAAIWVHTSLHEGFGLPPAEAMASGCALAGFANAGVSEFAVDGQNSLLVAVGDIDGLAGAIVRLIEDRQLRLRLAGQGSADLSVYTWERSVAAFEAALTAL